MSPRPLENLNLNCARGTYSYNKAGPLTSLVYSGTGNATQPSYTYIYVLDGNQITRTESSGRVTAYAYDALGRLAWESISPRSVGSITR